MKVERRLRSSTRSVEEKFRSVLEKQHYFDLKDFLLSKAMVSLFSRKDQELISKSNRKELVATASTKWYSSVLRKKTSAILADKNLLDEVLHEYFNEVGRMVYDRDKKELLLVCDRSFDDFSAAQYEEVCMAACETRAEMRTNMDILSIGYCDVTFALSLGISQRRNDYKESEQESLTQTGTEELCTLIKGYQNNNKKKTIPARESEDQGDVKYFYKQQSPPSSPTLTLGI